MPARAYTIISLTEDMIKEAAQLVPAATVNRTIASKIDTLTGHLGEFAFAQYFYRDFRQNTVGANKGRTDFPDIEVKASAFPFSENLNLLVREDYAAKRKPAFYVQVIINVADRKASQILPGTYAYIAGYATLAEIEQAPSKDFGSKLGATGGYRCKYIKIKDLHPMHHFRAAYNNRFKK